MRKDEDGYLFVNIFLKKMVSNQESARPEAPVAETVDIEPRLGFESTWFHGVPRGRRQELYLLLNVERTFLRPPSGPNPVRLCTTGSQRPTSTDWSYMIQRLCYRYYVGSLYSASRLSARSARRSPKLQDVRSPLS